MLWLLGILIVLGILLVGLYNSLVRLKVQCDNAWSDIDVQLKRRYDLIPNLIETVKGYAAHEKGTLEGVVAARNCVPWKALTSSRRRSIKSKTVFRTPAATTTPSSAT